MCTSQVEGVTAVYVMVKGLLDQILGFVAGELSHPARTEEPASVGRGGSGGGGEESIWKQPQHYLESRKMSFMSRLARNMNMLLCSLISVTALGGSEWPTATKPTFW